jgi:hypothetical protein
MVTAIRVIIMIMVIVITRIKTRDYTKKDVRARGVIKYYYRKTRKKPINKTRL